MIKYIQVALYLIISSWIQSIFPYSRPFSGSVRFQNGIKSQWGNINKKWIFKTMSNFIGLFLPPQLNWFVTIIAKLHAFKSCSPVLLAKAQKTCRDVVGEQLSFGCCCEPFMPTFPQSTWEWLLWTQGDSSLLQPCLTQAKYISRGLKLTVIRK